MTKISGYQEENGDCVIVAKDPDMPKRYYLVNVSQRIFGGAFQSEAQAVGGMKPIKIDIGEHVSHRGRPKKAQRFIVHQQGIYKGMQAKAGDLWKMYNSSYLFSHGFIILGSDISYCIHGELHQQNDFNFEVSGSHEGKPALLLTYDDVIEYLGDEKWKFVKHDVSENKTGAPKEAPDSGRAVKDQQS